MDDLERIPSKFLGIFNPQIVSHVFSIDGRVHHYEKDRFLTKRAELVPILTPSFYPGCQICPVTSAGNIGPAFLYSGGNTLDGALDHAVNNGLLQGIIVYHQSK